MSSPSPAVAEVRLSRSLTTRLFGGGSFQWFLTVVIVFELALVGVVTSFVGPGALLGLLAVLVPGLPWMFGVTAYARADTDGARWRYYRPRRYAWSQIERVEFGAVRRAGAAASVTVPAVRVQVGGHSHPIGPSVGVGAVRLTAFARELARVGHEHGVPSEIIATGEYWDPLRGL